MRSHRRSIVRPTVLARAAAAVALTLFIAACSTLGGQVDPLPRATVEFDNQSPDPVRVYLVVENGGDYLLGRVYPMQSNFLTIPRHLPASASGRIALVAVPLGEGGFSNRLERGPHTRELVSSLAELTTQRFVITPLALHGVFAAPSRFP